MHTPCAERDFREREGAPVRPELKPMCFIQKGRSYAFSPRR